LEESENKHNPRLLQPLLQEPSLGTVKNKEPQATALTCKSTQYQGLLQTPQRVGPAENPPDLNKTIASNQHTGNTVISVQSLTEPSSLHLYPQDTPVGIWACQQAPLYTHKATGFLVKQVPQGSGRKHC